MVFREIDRSKIKGDKMTFIPVNKYLYVGNIEEEGEEDSVILLPQDYRSVESPFAVVELLQSHSASDGILWGAGNHMVVEAHMLRDIQHNGETYTVIKENHVIGVLSED
jgi:co-chaperonin GroES (HSP10)